MITVHFHKANNADWIWTVQAANYKIIGSSSESYHNKQDCIDNFTQLTGREVGVETKSANLPDGGVFEDWTVKFE